MLKSKYAASSDRVADNNSKGRVLNASCPRLDINQRGLFSEFISTSEVMVKILKKTELVARTDSTVLITGETGTGKELLARAVHNGSSRRDRPMVKVNCSALPANLIESELFGHEKGAFTGATAQKTGRFELADGGTIFLDEIGDMPLNLQAKLLRVLQEGEFERIGNPNTIKIDARIIAATNRNLENAIKNGEFREDLFYRLNVFPINSPPLRERKEDIPYLVSHFCGKLGSKVGKEILSVNQKVLDQLSEYHWPGNVRELENVIERAIIISANNSLQPGDWIPKTKKAAQQSYEIFTLEENEKRFIMKVTEMTGGILSGERGAAKLLGINPNTLRSRMEKLGIKKRLSVC
jgi:formate hydrogenlyase transcriptional activator